jgi:diphthamide synthase (EF-2-diphthine--ammonia ligase)
MRLASLYSGGKDSTFSLYIMEQMGHDVPYLVNVKPRKEELLIDEMLAICSEIEAWKEKKASQEANARYNEILLNGLEE